MTRAKRRKLARQAAAVEQFKKLPRKRQQAAIEARKRNGGSDYAGREFGKVSFKDLLS